MYIVCFLDHKVSFKQNPKVEKNLQKHTLKSTKRPILQYKYIAKTPTTRAS